MEIKSGGFTPSVEQYAQANKLAKVLVVEFRKAFSFSGHFAPAFHLGSRETSFSNPMFMEDVRRELEQMVQDFRIYSAHGVGIPCIYDDITERHIPVSVEALTGMPESALMLGIEGSFRSCFDSGYGRLGSKGFRTMIWQEPLSLMDELLWSLTRFLGYRLAASRFRESQLESSMAQMEDRMTDASPDSTLGVLVHYRTANMRVHSSPAYFINWSYFGSTCSPVEGRLAPGLYRFAGDSDREREKIIDAGLFSIPANFEPKVVAF